MKDLTSYIDRARSGSIKNRILRVGVELEGAWKKVPFPDSFGGDGSVRFPDLSTPVKIGELITAPPLPPKDIPAWLKAAYPDFVNSSCGMHVHMSFGSAILYSRLMVEDYQKQIIKGINAWALGTLPDDHCIWSRLRGENTYCRNEFHPDIQARQTSKSYSHDGKNRYTMINYCFGQHGTMECRLLPMMPDAALAAAAIQEVLAITNAFLVAYVRKEKPIQAFYQVDIPAVEEMIA